MSALNTLSQISQTPHVSIEESIVAALAEELSVVLVEAGGVEDLAAALALDADLVEGGPVHRHHGLRRVDGGLADRAAGGRGGSCPTHPATTTTVRLGQVWQEEGGRY